jgi:uncharacterized iron-regulated membrane protein
MLNLNQSVILALAGAVMQLSAAATFSASSPANAMMKKDRPAQIEKIEGSNVKQLTLTDRAAKRLDIQTGAVADSSGRLTTPYSSVVYDSAGGTWVYTVPKPLTYVRQKIVVETISGDKAYLKEGPSTGTMVVTVGVAELYGTEKGLGY